MSVRLTILNGPNLNLLGIREPHIYGTTTLPAIEASCRDFARLLDVELSFHQSNHEGDLVDRIQAARTGADAVIMNPAAYSFTSIAILDALKALDKPFFEVHILSAAAKSVICGLGPYGYILAMQAAVQLLGKIPDTMPEPLRVGPR